MSGKIGQAQPPGNADDSLIIAMSSAADIRTTGAALDKVAFQVSHELRDPSWDALLASIPGSHFEQCSGWGAVKARYGWQVLRILASADGVLVGGVQALTRRIGRWGKIGYVARGPAVLPGHEGVDRLLAAQVSQLARR